VPSPEQIKRMAIKSYKRFGRLAILIKMPPTTSSIPFADLDGRTTEEVAKIIDVNSRTEHESRRWLRLMAEEERGRT